MSKTLPSTAKGAATEEAVYEAAIDLFAERGYHGTTLRQIAGAIDKQMATLYYYFDSKQSLLLMIMRSGMTDLIEGLEQELREIGSDDPVEKLRAAIRYHVLFHGHRAKEAFVVDSELRAVDEALLPEILEMRRRYQRIFEGLLREGVEAGIFRTADAAVAAIGILQMCTGVATWYRTGGRKALSDIADVYATMVLDGFRS